MCSPLTLRMTIWWLNLNLITHLRSAPTAGVREPVASSVAWLRWLRLQDGARWRPALTQHRLPDTSPSHRDTRPGHWHASWSPSSHEQGLSSSWKAFGFQNECKTQLQWMRLKVSSLLLIKTIYRTSWDFLILNYLSMFELLAKQIQSYELTQRL